MFRWTFFPIGDPPQKKQKKQNSSIKSCLSSLACDSALKQYIFSLGSFVISSFLQVQQQLSVTLELVSGSQEKLTVLL